MEDRNQRQYDLTGKITFPKLLPEFSGNYSFVYRGEMNHISVAVKVIKSIGDDPTMRRKLLRERSIWAALNHPNILPFIGYADDDSDERFRPFGAFISPWYENGDAARFLRERGDSLTKATRVELWRGVIEGVSFLHGNSPVVIHGDLKPANVVIDDQGSPRICDFGLASLHHDSGVTHTETATATEFTGTDRYLAPELVIPSEAKPKPTTASDMWAVGCLGLEFIYSRIPYAGKRNNHACIKAIGSGELPAERKAIGDSKDHKRGLVLWCWASAPEIRPSATELRYYLTPPENHSESNLENLEDTDSNMENLGDMEFNPESLEDMVAALQERTDRQSAENGNLREILANLHQENLQLKQSQLRLFQAAVNNGRPSDNPHFPIIQAHGSGIDINGEWHAHEMGFGHIEALQNYSKSTYLFKMITPTAFIGIGAGNNLDHGTILSSYSFQVVDGVIGHNGAISWVCNSSSIPATWIIKAALSGDGMTIHGQVVAVDGNVVGGLGTYTRVR